MSEIKKIYILKVLHTIHHRLSVDSIVELGLEYYQIAQILSDVIRDGLVEDTDDGLKLTERGAEKLTELGKQIYPNISKNWILPSEENRIPKIDKFGIYLPRKKKNAQ